MTILTQIFIKGLWLEWKCEKFILNSILEWKVSKYIRMQCKSGMRNTYVLTIAGKTWFVASSFSLKNQQNTLIYLLNKQYLLSAPVYKIFKTIKLAGWIKHASVHKSWKKLSMLACLIDAKTCDKSQ